MRVLLALGLFFLFVPASAQARSGPPPLRDPVFLNIGFVCKWQDRCMKRQQRAMRQALGFVRGKKPPAWKVQQCNRNAKRIYRRVDWIGFNNCIRNPKLTRRRR